MSTEPSPPPGAGRTLGQYIGALIETLGRADPAALARMREVVRGRRARVRLDDEEVEIHFAAGALAVERPSRTSAVDGRGSTDRATVLELMDGNLEVGDAISSGRLDVVAEVDAVAAMFAAIEILIDASSRSPELQALAREFRERPAPGPPRAPLHDRAARAPRPAERLVADERALLARLDLLPDGADAPPHRL